MGKNTLTTISLFTILYYDNVKQFNKRKTNAKYQLSVLEPR